MKVNVFLLIWGQGGYVWVKPYEFESGSTGSSE